MFKKICIGGVSCLLLILSACGRNQTVKTDDLSSTNLASIYIDGIVIGQSIDDIDLTSYIVAKDSFEQNENAYYFEELHIETNADGIIQNIRCNLSGDNTVPFLAAGEANLKTINDVVKLLGQNHNDYWFDRGQGLKAHTYHDGESGIYVTFAYHNNSGELVWAILNK